MDDLCKYCKQDGETLEVVRDVNIRVMQGEYVIIDGIKGRQKNSFFNLLGCLERPSKGKYIFDYDDISVAKNQVLDNIRKNKIGYLFRDFNLIGSKTVRENVEMPMLGLDISYSEKEKRTEAALEKAGIGSLADKKAMYLPEYEKQLTGLARALVNKPMMILADEPSANMDRESAEEFIKLLNGINCEGISVVMFTDQKGIYGYEKCRRISFENGRKVKDEDPYSLSLVRREA